MLDYTSVKNQYDLLYGAGVTKKSMPEWATEMNQLTGSNLYDQGTRDGWWTRASHFLDEKVFKPYSYTVLPVAPIAAGIGSLLGNEEAGRRFGESLPRTLAETAPLYLGPIGAPITGGLMAAHSYADTGSAKAAAIAGVTGTALPFVGKLGGTLAARAFGTAENVATETATGTLPFDGGWFPKEGSETAFKAATFGGSQAAQIGLNEASMYATAKATNTEFDPLSPEFLAQQIPFTVFDAVHAGLGRTPNAKAVEQTRVAPEPPAPERVVPPSPPEQQAQVDALFSKLQEITSPDSTASPEERAATLGAALKAVNDPTTVQALKTFGKTGELPPTTVTGWGQKLEKGSHKIVVDPERSDANIKLPDHGNVFVNNAEPTVNPDGSLTFSTALKNYNPRVTSPLKLDEVRPNPNQPELPVQKNGLAPDETRVFEKVGIKPAEIDPMLDPVKNPTGTMAAIAEIQKRNAPLKPIAQELEQTQGTLESAKESIATVPQTAEEVARVTQPATDLWPTDVPKSVREYIPAVKLADGTITSSSEGHDELQLHLTDTQREQSVRGYTTPDGRFLTLLDVAREIQQHQVKSAIDEGHTPTQAVEAARLTSHTPVVDESLEQQNVLKAAAEKVISTDLRGKPQAQYGDAVRDENGENFKTRALAEAFRDADPDLADHVVRNAGRDKGFYLAPQINKEVSLEGTNLEAVLSDPTPVDSRPDVSIQDALSRVQALGKNVGIADELLSNDGDFAKTLKELKFTREFWQNKLSGKDVVLDPEMQKVVDKVTRATGEWNTRFRSWDLGSDVPHDEALVQKMGVREGGIRAGLDWFVNHPQSGNLGEFVGGMLKASDANGRDITNEVDFIHDPHNGWSYDPNGRNGKPEITYPRLPTSENDAFDWATKGAEEVAHHLGAGILTRSDPQAVQFRARLNEVSDALSQSKIIPKEVLRAVTRSKAEGWYESWRRQETAPEDLYEKFREVAGTENDKWFGTFYAMQNEHELFANIFRDSQLRDVLAKTQLPKSQEKITLLQHFSRAMNRLFGGKPENDNALHEILTRFEDYLSGPKLAQRTMEIRPNLSAGEGFFYGIAPYDSQRNTLGGKHALPKSGIVSTNQFKSIGGIGKPLADGEIELYKSLVPEAFQSAGNVNVPKLVEGLKTKGPVVEVRKLGEKPFNEPAVAARNRARELQHELETAGYSVNLDLAVDGEDTSVYKDGKVIQDGVDPKVDELYALARQGSQINVEGDPRTTGGQYSFLGPKPESNMPGYVEGLVRVPTTLERVGPTTERSRQGTYVGPHFGTEDQNVLSFYRGYEETLPDSTKAFHVIEVQSDWGQMAREQDMAWRKEGFKDKADAIAHGKIDNTQNHPLLKVYESLALKAAIAHAKEIGASKVILSDAETAMMTEGHDRVATKTYKLGTFEKPEAAGYLFWNDKTNRVEKSTGKFEVLPSDNVRYQKVRIQVESGWVEEDLAPHVKATTTKISDEHYVKVQDVFNGGEQHEVNQEKGMRLHYDTTMPSIMEKLTGVKGEGIVLGTHKSSAPDSGTQNIIDEAVRTGHITPEEGARRKAEGVGSPVFKNPDGTPKTQITGRVYDISKVPSDQTLFDNKPGMTQVKNPSIYNGRDYLRDALIAKGVRPEGLVSRIDSVEKLFSTGDLSASLEGFQREQTAGTLPATTESGPINDGFRTALLQGTPTEVYQSIKGLLADEVPVHQDVWARLRQDVLTAQELRKNIEKGYVPGSVPDGLEAKLKEAYTRINAMKNGLEKQDVAIQGFKNLLNFTVDGMENSLAGQLTQDRLPAPPDPTGLEGEAREGLGLVNLRTAASRAELEKGAMTKGRDFLIRNLMFTQFSKQQVPGFRPVSDHVQQEQGDAFMRMARLNLVRSYDPETGEMSKKTIRDNQRVEQNPNLARNASDIRRWIQLQNKEGKTWSLDDPFVKDVLGRSGDPEAIKTELRTELARRDDMVKQVMPAFLSKYNQEVVAFAIAARETGMKPDVARDLSSQMMQSLGLLQDPTTAPYGLDTLRMVSAKMQADTYLKSIGLAKELIDGSQKHLDFMASTPGYTTEQRFDKHHIVMVTPDQKPFRASYGTKDAALTRVKELEAKGYKFLDYVPKSDANVPGGLQEGVINAMKELDNQATVKLQNALSDKPDILAQIAPLVQRANDYEASQAAFSPLPGAPAPRRQFIGGREEINMVTNSNLMYIKLNNWMRHKLVRASSDLDMLDPDLQSNKVALDYARQHVENQLSLDNPLTRKIIEATYNWKLAWNFGVNFLHGIQSLTTGMSSLIAETNSVGDALAMTVKAQKSVIQRNTTGKWDTAEHEWLANNLAARGHAGIASWSDFIDLDRGNLYDAGKPPGVAKSAINTVKNAARSWTGMFLRFNDQIGALAAFDLGRERGMSQEDALNYAIDVKNRGYFTGGKSQRAVGLWSIKTKPVPQLMTSLQGYTFGWFSQLMNNYVRGFGRPDVPLTESERSGARKAFIYSLSAQAVMAGAIGLPGVGQGLALVKQTTGFDTKGWLRQHLADFFGEDQDNGGLMTSLALHGAVASFTPIDPSGRHMPTFPFTGISPYKGFDIANLATAPVSAVADVVKGLMAAAKGDVHGASTLLPHVLQGPFQLLEGEGDIRDARGGLTYQLSPAERFVTALGMTPSRVQAAKDTANAVKDLQAAQTQQKEHLVDDIATTYRKQGPRVAQTKLAAYMQENPKEDGPGLVQAVASQVRKQTLPYDYRRSVSPKVDLAGLASRMPSSEVDGRNLEYDVQKNLGLTPRFNIRGDFNAASIDQLMNSNPYLSRAAALHQVSETSRVRRPSRVLNFQQPQSLFQGQ